MDEVTLLLCRQVPLDKRVAKIRNLYSFLRKNTVFCLRTTNFSGILEGYVVPASAVKIPYRNAFFFVVYFEDAVSVRYLVGEEIYLSLEECLFELRNALKMFPLVSFGEKHRKNSF